MSILTRRWGKLVYEHCLVCGHLTPFCDAEGGEPQCSSREDALRGPKPDDHRLDDPRHGQAAAINKGRA